MNKYMIVAEEIDGSGSYPLGGGVDNWVVKSDALADYDSRMKKLALTEFKKRYHVTDDWLCSSYCVDTTAKILSIIIAFLPPSEGRYCCTFYKIKICLME